MDNQIWAMFFASIVSFQYHPRNEHPMSLEDAALLADAMLRVYRERGVLWHG